MVTVLQLIFQVSVLYLSVCFSDNFLFLLPIQHTVLHGCTFYLRWKNTAATFGFKSLFVIFFFFGCCLKCQFQNDSAVLQKIKADHILQIILENQLWGPAATCRDRVCAEASNLSRSVVCFFFTSS